MTEINDLAGVSEEELVDAFSDAFSRYYFPIHMTEAVLRTFIVSRDVDMGRSFGCFEDGALLAFVLNGIRTSGNDGASPRDRRIAYTAATGVRLSAQGKGLGTRLMQHSVDMLRAAGCRSYTLEVIVENQRAIGAYQRSGFTVTDTLECYRGKADAPAAPATAPERGAINVRTPGELAVTVRLVDADWRTYREGVPTFRPTWQQSDQAVDALSAADPSSVRMIHVSGPAVQHSASERTGAAFGVLNVATGNLMQLGWRNRAAAHLLLQQAQELSSAGSLSVLNVPAATNEIHEDLMACGLARALTQYEMRLEL